jgi:hypothetical protein
MRSEAEVRRAIDHLEKALCGAIVAGRASGVSHWESPAAQIDKVLGILRWVEGSDEGTFARLLAEFERADAENTAILEEQMEAETPGGVN